MVTARSKKANIIAGYVSAPLIFDLRSWLFLKFSDKYPRDTESFPVCSPDSIIEISALLNTWGTFFIDLLNESPLET